MSLNDSLANAISHIYNSEKSGKKSCKIRNSSKMIKSVLEILKKHDYVEDYKVTKIKQGEFVDVTLKNSINKCGSIKPRFPVQIKEFEKFEKRFLPAKDFGILIVSTPKGVMTHNKAIENNIGGKLIAYCY